MDNRLELTPYTEWGLFPQGQRPLLIAGPCSAESEMQIMMVAKGLKKAGVGVLRAGIWKPRTHPGCFEGVGTIGLKWLQKAKAETGLKICTEVASEKHVFECIKFGVDMVWVGARTSANPFLMQEIADALRDTDIPVLVKNPVNPDLDLWIGALERLNRAGIKKLGVILRGFSTSEKIAYRNAPGWQTAVELRSRFPEMLFIADPSHMAGDRKYLKEISQRALDLGLDGLMVESHPDPSCAMSDAKQQLTPEALQTMIGELVVREQNTDNREYREGIDQLRAQIDIIDENILYSLKSRMAISRKIGKYKKDHNIAILQMSRWDEVLDGMIAAGKEYGLSKELISAVFNAIHEESVTAQNEVLSDSSSE